MVQITDFLYNESDLTIQNGDFVIADNSLQLARSIILASKGEFRNNPMLGVGINRFIGASNIASFLTNIVKGELIKDGLSLYSFDYTSSGNSLEMNINLK